jgi:DNA-binding CsgD family transcriptional regulator
MIGATELVRFSRLLVELRDSAEYLPAAAFELGRLLNCDDVFSVESDFPAGRFVVWRASKSGRDSHAEEAMPLMRNHPAIESFERDPMDLAPRRLSDFTNPEPERPDSLGELLGRHQIAMMTHVDHAALRGGGWVMARERREFNREELDISIRLQPIVLALDRLHHRAGAAPSGRSVEDSGWADLSIREREVVDLLATGLTAPAIARMLGISPRTVGKHLEHVYRKLGRHDRLLVAQSVPWRRDALSAGG